MNKSWAAALIAAAVFGGAGFWGGMTYAAAQRPNAAFGANGAMFPGRTGAGGAARMNGVVGTIIGKDATSITVQLGGPNASSTNGASSGTRIVLYGSTTQIEKTVAGSASDLTAGTSVLVAGEPNSDGSISASNIQIRPAGAGFGRPNAQ